jgi:thiosulfate dehydrogenase (quinone) large subunit
MTMRPTGSPARSSMRPLALGLGIVAAVLLAWMYNPWLSVPEGIRPIVTVAFWIAAIALLVVLYLEARRDPHADEVQVEGPAFARFLFNNTSAGLFWLPIRLFLGFSWLGSGWGKITSPEWTEGGAALRGYWERAVAIPEEGRPAISFEWYRDFLNTLLAGNHETWFSWVVMAGELAVGIGLLLGALTGVAAFFGALMNMSFLLAGSASTNPVLFTFAIGLILAWRVAGYYGLDRWLLPMLGTPWRPAGFMARPTGSPGSMSARSGDGPGGAATG